MKTIIKHLAALAAILLIPCLAVGQLTPEFRSLSVNTDGTLRGPTNFIDANGIVRTATNGALIRAIVPSSSQHIRWASDTTELYHLGDSFTYGANATTYTNNYPSQVATAMGLPGVNLANGSFTIADMNWASFSGWAVTNSGFAFVAPTTITENQNWTLLGGFNELRTPGTSSGMFRKGLDHNIHWVSIPSSAKRFAQAPESSTGTWTPIPWSNGMGAIGAYSSSGTLTFNGVIGSDIFVGYIGWATNFGGSISISIDGNSVTNFSTASAAYGNREYINGSDANIPDHVGPYGNGKLDFCPQVFRATDLGFGSHTVTITAASNPCYVLWVAGNGWSRTPRKGPNVFVGTIPRQSPWTAPGTDALHASFNGQIVAAVAAAKASGLRVALSPVAAAYMPSTMQSGDGVHPNNIGHTAIASAFQSTFEPDLPSVLASAAATQPAGGAGIFSTLSVSGASDFVGNITGHGRLLMLPTAISLPGGVNSRFGYGATAASSMSFQHSDSNLDRTLVFTGNSIGAVVTSTGADSDLFLGNIGRLVTIQGNESVVGTLGVNGITTLANRLLVLPTPAAGGFSHRFGGAPVAASAFNFIASDSNLDRLMTITPNSLVVTVNSSGAGADFTMGSSGNTVALAGNETVAGTLTATGAATLNGGLTVNKTLSGSSGTEIANSLAYTLNQSGTASAYGLSIALTQTAVGSGVSRPINVAVGGTNRFYVQADGRFIVISPTGTTGPILRGDGATDSQIMFQHAVAGLDRRMVISGDTVTVYDAAGSVVNTLNLGDVAGLVNIKGKLQMKGGPTISTGTGVPATSEANGSMFMRSDGTGPNLYVRENGAWVAK